MKTLSNHILQSITESAAFTRAGLIKKAESFDDTIASHLAKIYLWPSSNDTSKHARDVANWIMKINSYKCSTTKPKLSQLVLIDRYPLDSQDLHTIVGVNRFKTKYNLDIAEQTDTQIFADKVNILISSLDKMSFDYDDAYEKLVTSILERMTK